MKRIIKSLIPGKYHLPLRRALFIITHFNNGKRNYFCPCCKTSLKQFLPFGMTEVKRPSALCPICGALERHRLLNIYLGEKTDIIQRKIKLLHIAPELVLTHILKYRPNITYVSVDLGSTPASVKMDITNAAFRDGEFDAIVCNHVMEHILEDLTAMRELFRVLKPGGWAIIQPPVDKNRLRTYEDPAIVDPADRLREFGQEDHVRIYGLDYPDRLRSAGFTVKVDPFARELSAESIQKYGLEKDAEIYFSVKPK